MSDLIQEAKVVTVKGEDFLITPYTFGQLPRVAKHIANIGQSISLEDIDLQELAAVGGEDVLALCSIATGKSRSFFDTVGTDEGLALIAAIVEVNKDFFVKKLAPALGQVTKAIMGTASA